jgi:hypothetical protein
MATKDIGVLPRDEDIRKHLKHPMTYPNRGFANFPDPTPWPYDQFTMRRLLEGAITSPEWPPIEQE